MQIVTIKAKHGQLKARIRRAKRVRVGEAVGLNFDSERLVVFDARVGKRAQEAVCSRGLAVAEVLWIA